MNRFGKVSKLAIALVLGATFASGTFVEAQTWAAQNRQQRDQRSSNRPNQRGRNWDRYGQYGGSFQLRQTALNAGYNEGIKEGRKDRNRGRHDFRGNSAYRNASKDYSAKLG
ncbi:MAG: hypothetical protein QOJ88_1762, partial [Pyrinomonadaceae bacterium]|nr:hypothetical protein [Pyrinomonadaceae bacterium]